MRADTPSEIIASTGDLTVLLAPPDLEHLVLQDIRTDVITADQRLFVCRGRERRSPWAQNTWLTPQVIAFDSIKDAATKLAAIQRNWWPHPTNHQRRTMLIADRLPHVSAKTLDFPAKAPEAPLGSFTLLTENLMLASPQCSSPFPDGEVRFHEFKEGPPSRAYLKLFEALTLFGSMPGPGDQCLELGAAPGGWTWVLARLGAPVTAWDRADLDPAVVAMPGVTSRRGDAFTATPDKAGPCDWLFSDVICYPEKLYDFLMAWIGSGACRHIVATLKFQGADHYHIIPQFVAIPGGSLRHLWANKHELTFFWSRPD